LAVPVDGRGTASVEAVKVLPVPGVQKTSSPGRKTILGLSHCGFGKEGVETSGSKSDTRLVAELGGQPRLRGLSGSASDAVKALRQLTAMTSSHDPTPMVKELGPQRRTAKGPSKSGRRGGTTLPRWTQTRGAERSSAGSSLGSWVLKLCLGKETAGACKVLEKILIMESIEISWLCKNLLSNTMGAPKTTSAGERPLSSLGCAQSPRSTKGNSSDYVAARGVHL
jgi:hypothetical protein